MDETINLIKEPWQKPIEYSTLAFWFVIFILVGILIFDGVVIASSFIKSNASKVLENVT
jgi:hypothetical protein